MGPAIAALLSAQLWSATALHERLNIALVVYVVVWVGVGKQ